jgi:hypothetical protein
MNPELQRDILQCIVEVGGVAREHSLFSDVNMTHDKIVTRLALRAQLDALKDMVPPQVHAIPSPDGTSWAITTAGRARLMDK